MRAQRLLLALSLGVLAPVMTPAQELTEPEIQAWEKAADILRKGAENSIDFPLNTVPEGCLSNPLPLTPVGPTETIEIEGFMDSAEMTIWRVPCRPDNSALMVTVTPIEGEMFVCSSRIQITQNETVYDSARLVVDVETGDRLCIDVTEPVSAVVDQPPLAQSFDHNQAFELLYRGSENVIVEIGPYEPEQFFGPEEFTRRILRPEFSGLWMEPDSPGHGFQFLFAENAEGLTMVVYWFAYEAGQQRFFFGTQVVEAGQREIEVALQQSSGADFGAAFDPGDVVISDFGRVFVSFDNCNQGEVRYERTSDGEQGTLAIERLTTLAGLTCRELKEE